MKKSPWTPEERAILSKMYRAGAPTCEMALALDRSQEAVTRQITQLDLVVGPPILKKLPDGLVYEDDPRAIADHHPLSKQPARDVTAAFTGDPVQFPPAPTPLLAPLPANRARLFLP